MNFNAACNTVVNQLLQNNGFDVEYYYNLLKELDMNKKVIGTCSICGGKVVVYQSMEGASVPTCTSCGAVKRETMPVIPMEPTRPRRYRTDEWPRYKERYEWNTYGE
jgi:hypothetical protein